MQNINQNNADQFVAQVSNLLTLKRGYRLNKDVRECSPSSLVNTMQKNQNIMFFLVQPFDNGACFIQADGYKTIFVFDSLNATDNPKQFLSHFGLFNQSNLVVINNDKIKSALNDKMTRTEKSNRKKMSLGTVKCSGKGYRGGVKALQASNMQDRIVRYIDKMRNPSWKVEKELLFNSFLACIELFNKYYTINSCETRLRYNATTGNMEKMNVGQMRRDHANVMLDVIGGFKGMFCWYDMTISEDDGFIHDYSKRYSDGLAYVEMMLEQDALDMASVLDYDRDKTQTYSVDKAFASGIENVIVLFVEVCKRMIEKRESFVKLCLTHDDVQSIHDMVDCMSLDELLSCGFIKPEDVTDDVDADALYDIAQARAIVDWNEDVRDRHALVEQFVEYAAI